MRLTPEEFAKKLAELVDKAARPGAAEGNRRVSIALYRELGGLPVLEDAERARQRRITLQSFRMDFAAGVWGDE